MKVLYISGMYPNPTYPQKGIFCHEQVKALKKLGVEVDVLVPMTIYDKEYTTKIWEYEGVTIRYIRYIKYPGVRFFEHIGKALYLSLLCSGINFKQYDILHADAPLPAGDTVMRLSRKYNIPYVVHGHGLDVFLGESYAGLKNCNQIIRSCQKVYQEADAVIGVSRKVLDKIQQKVDITEKAFVAYNGVDVEKFTPAIKTKSDDVVRIISIGNLIPLKGHEYTLQAVRQLIDQGCNSIHLTLLGRGEFENELKELTKSLEIESYVTFGGYVPYEDVAMQLQKSDIFVLPSYYEALGCVYLEAMACGVPAIGCKYNGIDEIIQDGKTGYLVEIKNVQQITERLRDLIKDEKCHKMGVQARQLVMSRYQWIHSAESVVQVYRYALSARGIY